MKKQPDLTERTRKNIMEAFWSIYAVKRIEKITIKEIAQKAGYNRGTIYEYFADAYDILEQIENSLIPALEELPPLPFPNGSLDISIDMFIKLYEQNHQYYTVLLGDRGDPAFALKLKNTVKPMISRTLTSNDMDEIELDFILEYVLSAMIGILSYWFRQEKALPLEHLITLMYDLMENGVMIRLAQK
jgi:AcrR family transcriptional regulator